MSMLGTLLLGLLRLKALIMEAMIRKINLVMFINYFSGEILNFSDLSYFLCLHFCKSTLPDIFNYSLLK